MKIACRFSLVLTVLLIFSFSLSAAGQTDKAPAAVQNHELAGDYQIDISRFGMPLVFYLRINADGTFALSPNTLFNPNESRGEGKLASSSGTYMMIYKEHTQENPKTATFITDGPNLVFQSRLPYGQSNILNTAEDPDDPGITYVLSADILALTEYHGTYAGTHTTQAMGSSVEYVYTLLLKPGLRYQFDSAFQMAGENYGFSESGTWSVDGEQFVMHPADEEPVTGTISADNQITIAIKPSAMARSRTESTLRVATHAHLAGTYLAEKSSPMYTAEAVLVLDMFGGYTYTAAVGQPENYEEAGTYSADGANLTLKPAEGQEYTALLENKVLKGNFKVIGPMPGTELTFFNSAIQGEFTGTAVHEEIEYTTLLSLKPDGKFDLLVTDAAGTEIIKESGSFQTRQAMTLMVILDGVEPAPNCSIGADGLNLTLTLPGMTADKMGGLGFSLRK